MRLVLNTQRKSAMDPREDLPTANARSSERSDAKEHAQEGEDANQRDEAGHWLHL